MLMPSIFGENLFDDFFGDFPFYYDDRAMKDTEKKLYGRRASHIMKPESTRMNWWTSGKYLLTKIFPRKNALPPLSARSKILTASAAAISW